MRRASIVFAVFAMSMFVFSACSGTSGDDGNGDENGNQRTLLGTCKGTDSNGNVFDCKEVWFTGEPAEEPDARERWKNTCRGQMWLPNEESCPTSGDYDGTCISEGHTSISKNHYYDVDVQAKKESCEEFDATWKVE